MSLEKQNNIMLMEHIVAEIENCLSLLVQDRQGEAMHRLQELVSFLEPGLEAMKGPKEINIEKVHLTKEDLEKLETGGAVVVGECKDVDF